MMNVTTKKYIKREEITISICKVNLDNEERQLKTLLNQIEKSKLRIEEFKKSLADSQSNLLKHKDG